MDNWKSEGFWIKTFFIIIFYGILNLALFVLLVLAVGQWLSRLISGEGVEPLRDWLVGLASYIKQILLFITFEVEDKPYPFADWPTVSDDSSAL